MPKHFLAQLVRNCPLCTSRLERLDLWLYSLLLGLYTQGNLRTNFIHLCVESFSIKGVLILVEKSAFLVDVASMAADFSSIGTE